MQQRGSAVASGSISLLEQEKFAAIVGQPYYALKQTLIIDEQVLLRTISFEIVIEHPHKYLLNFGKLIDAKHSLIQIAISILNDSIVHTRLCLAHPPADIAAACLHIADEILGVTLQTPCLNASSAWSALGVNMQQMEMIELALLDMIAIDTQHS